MSSINKTQVMMLYLKQYFGTLSNLEIKYIRFKGKRRVSYYTFYSSIFDLSLLLFAYLQFLLLAFS